MCSPGHATVLLNWFWEKLHLSCWASVFPSNQSSTKGKFFWAWIEMIQVLNKCFLNLHFSANFLAPEETLRFYFLYVKIRVRFLSLGKILREWLRVRPFPLPSLTWKRVGLEQLEIVLLRAWSLALGVPGCVCVLEQVTLISFVKWGSNQTSQS